MSERTGPGTTKGTPLTPEQAAARLARLAAGRMKQQQSKHKKEDMAALAVEVSGLSLHELRHRLTNRNWMVATLAVGGYGPKDIARALGYATADVAVRSLARPDVKRMISLIQEAQLEKAINGEFGVQAQAKAAAPKVTRRVIEKAGGIEDKDGRPVGMAYRDADAIRASETVLRLSGDLADRKENVHLHWISTMSPEERRKFADEGVWPDKYRHIEDQLTRQQDARTIDVTPENGRR